MYSELEKCQLWLPYPMNDGEREGFWENKESFLKRDYLSHYILRFAFCKSRESKDWFVKQEARLFSLRLRYLKDKARAKFYEASGNAHARYTGNLVELQSCTQGARIFGGAAGMMSYGGRKAEVFGVHLVFM